MQKVLFIDRDGTLIREPQPSQQVDSLDKLEFLPRVLSALRRIALETDYELVMVTNQDGLGTVSFPEETFWPAHEKMMTTLANEDIRFAEVCIDRHFPHQNSPTRKPQTGMLTRYQTGDYDLPNSYVIGDRLTDVQLAKNLGTKAILLNFNEIETPGLAETPNGLTPDLAVITELLTDDWDKIYAFLRLPDRLVTVRRDTKETRIAVTLNLDGRGRADIQTGLGFFDHMLDQLARHGSLDLTICTEGDLHIDEHHTIEDTALALGEAFRLALGDKRGLTRYGFLLPMDEALAQVAVDFSGRPWLVWNAEFKREKIGEMPTEMFFHFFKSFCDTAGCNLNIRVEGDNEHHKIEAIFKGFAKAVRMAVARDLTRPDELPTTKGVL